MAKKKEFKTLNKILHSKALENKVFKIIKKFNSEMLNSLNYWLKAQYHKYIRGDINSLSNALKIEFTELQDTWTNKADDFANKVSEYINKHSVVYVNSNLYTQGMQIKKQDRLIKDVLNAKFNEHIALIKSIPEETILRYKSALYNNISSFDLHALNKQILTISGISKRRARTIARDQVAKTIESYHIAKSQQYGFEYYVWNTIKDERTSKGKGGHLALDKRIYKYSEPTAIIDSYGNVGIPAQRVNCRCTSTALIVENGKYSLKKVKDNVHGDYYILV